MSVAKIVEISAESNNSFEEAIEKGVQRATDSLENVRGAWVKEQKVRVENGKIVAYRVHLAVTFVLN